MRIRIITWLLAAFFSASGPGWSTEPNRDRHIYPLPLSEAQDVVTGWLENNAFQVCELAKTQQSVQVSAGKSQIRWRILLRRHSPLATRIHVEVVQQDATGGPLVQTFRRHIENYIIEAGAHTPAAMLSIPASVRALGSTVVCIHADSTKGSDLQITGFVVDEQGLIVCTGHDLNADSSVRVRLSDGRQLDGRMIKYDPFRDLALVKVDEPLVAAVSLQNGRNVLHPGDRLFAITCPNGVSSRIEAGYLQGPPRRVSGAALWQARIHISHGSSGSPVFDDKGHLAAVVKGRFRGTDTVGFLIPLETLLQFLEED